jgi:hypothetical protein
MPQSFEQGGAVGITTKLRAGRSRVRMPVQARYFLFLKTSRLALGPPSFLFSGYRRSFPGLKRLRREANLSSPSSAEFKNEWNHTSAPPVCFHGMICTVMTRLCRIRRGRHIATHLLTFDLTQIRLRLGSGSVSHIAGSLFNFRHFGITCQNVSARSQSFRNSLFYILRTVHHVMILGKRPT